MIWPVLAVALVLRAVGAGFGLPHLYHQDEPIVVNHALAYASFDFNPYFFKIPPLVSYLLFGVYGIYFLVLKLFTGISSEQFAQLFFRDPSSFYYLGRMVFGVTLGTATVAALYQLARRCLLPRGALMAAALSAVNFLHVRDSHYIYADIPMLLCILMSFVALRDHQGQGDRRSFLAACFWAGAAIAFKYIAAVMLVPFFWVLVVKRGWRHGLTGVTAVSVVYLALNPFSVIDLPFFLKEIADQAASETHMPLWHHWNYSVLEGMGLVASVLGVVGLAWDLVKTSDRRWLWAFPFFYYAVITVFSQPYERYAMPLVPFLCLGAGSFLVRVGTWRLPQRKALVLGLFLLAAWPSLAKSLAMDRLMTTEDTRTQAKTWIEANVPAGTGVALDHTAFSPRLLQTPEQLRQKLEAISPDEPHASEKRKKVETLIEAQKGKPAYTVHYLNLQNIEKPSFLMWSPLIAPKLDALHEKNILYVVRHRNRSSEANAFDAELQTRSEAVMTFSPYKDASKVFTEDEWANTALPFRSRELFSRERSGPVIEIVRLKRDV